MEIEACDRHTGLDLSRFVRNQTNSRFFNITRTAQNCWSLLKTHLKGESREVSVWSNSFAMIEILSLINRWWNKRFNKNQNLKYNQCNYVKSKIKFLKSAMYLLTICHKYYTSWQAEYTVGISCCSCCSSLLRSGLGLTLLMGGAATPQLHTSCTFSSTVH